MVRRECEISDDLEILLAVSIGYEDPEFRADGLRIGREDAEKYVVTFPE